MSEALVVVLLDHFQTHTFCALCGQKSKIIIPFILWGKGSPKQFLLVFCKLFTPISLIRSVILFAVDVFRPINLWFQHEQAGVYSHLSVSVFEFSYLSCFGLFDCSIQPYHHLAVSRKCRRTLVLFFWDVHIQLYYLLAVALSQCSSCFPAIVLT